MKYQNAILGCLLWGLLQPLSAAAVLVPQPIGMYVEEVDGLSIEDDLIVDSAALLAHERRVQEEELVLENREQDAEHASLYLPCISPTSPHIFRISLYLPVSPREQDAEQAAALTAVAPAVPAATIGERLSRIDLSAGEGLQSAIGEAAALMADGDLLSAHARCFGYFNPTPAWPGVLADLLSAVRNPQLCVVSHAPASVTVSSRLLCVRCERDSA